MLVKKAAKSRVNIELLEQAGVAPALQAFLKGAATISGDKAAPGADMDERAQRPPADSVHRPAKAG